MATPNSTDRNSEKPVPPHAIAALADAAGRAADSVHAKNKKLLTTLLEMPGGRELLRRELAQRNVDMAMFERLLRGEVLPEDAATLLSLNIGQS